MALNYKKMEELTSKENVDLIKNRFRDESVGLYDVIDFLYSIDVEIFVVWSRPNLKKTLENWK